MQRPLVARKRCQRRYPDLRESHGLNLKGTLAISTFPTDHLEELYIVVTCVTEPQNREWGE